MMGNVYLISRDLDRVVLFQIAVENKFTALQVEYFLTTNEKVVINNSWSLELDADCKSQYLYGFPNLAIKQ